MTPFADTAVIVLAAGQSQRYDDGDKLKHSLLGQPLGLHIVQTLRRLGFAQRIGVCSDRALAGLYSGVGFEVVINRAPHEGQSTSLKLGLACTGRVKRVLVCLGDMPFVSAAHLLNLDAAYRAQGAAVVASTAGDYRGPPVLFDAGLLHAEHLAGDRGARRFLAGATFVSAPPEQLIDFDQRKDFAPFEPTLPSRSGRRRPTGGNHRPVR
jgi:molybdenum cofactor cytidylyltransferase